MQQRLYRVIIGLLLAAFGVVVLIRRGAAEPDWKSKIPDKHQLKKSLTRLQYDVTQREATEPPFNNAYWDNKGAGIYVDIVSGEPLFSSLDKYDSGTGWPSFKKPLQPSNVRLKPESSIFNARIEVRSKHADSHLGHVFDDGPEPSGKRYCINSAALRFIPVSEMKKAGSIHALRHPR